MINQAEKDLKVKLNLERMFRKEVRSLFALMLSDFKVTYSATGGIPIDGKYNNQWESLLKKQYTRVQKQFTKKVTIEKKKIEIVEDDDNIESLLLLALLTWKDENSETGSELIGATTSKQMRQAITQARELLEEQGESTDKRSIALTATAILKRKFKGRVDNIVMTETQNSAESTKHLTGESLDRAIIESPDIDTAPVGVVTKTWMTVGDNKVRPTHKVANGQKRLLSQSFIVGGQFLKHPGDRSLGATAEETSGCRCSSILSVLGSIVNFHGI